MSTRRINVTLDSEHATKLAQLAARVQVNEGTVARSLLAAAIDDAHPDATSIVTMLDGIDAAWDRAQLGRRQADSGATITLDEL